MGSDPTPPQPYQDPQAEAAAQAKYNQQAQEGSLVNQQGPYGSQNYTSTVDPNTGAVVYTAHTQLSDPQQAILNNQQGAQISEGNAANILLGNTLPQYETNASLLPTYDANGNVTTPGGSISNNTQSLTSSLLKQYTDYLNPQFDYQSSTLDNQLRNQGLEPGTPAYDQQMKNLRLNQDQAVTGFLAQAEPQAYQQALSQYELPLQNAQALLSGASPTPLSNVAPANTSAAQIQPANYTGAVNSYNQLEQQNYQSEVAAQQNMMSGLFGIPTALAKLPTAGGGSIGGNALMALAL